MSVRLGLPFTTARTALRQCEARLAAVQSVARKHDIIATDADNPAELAACLEDLWLAIFGYSRP